MARPPELRRLPWPCERGEMGTRCMRDDTHIHLDRHEHSRAIYHSFLEGVCRAQKKSKN